MQLSKQFVTASNQRPTAVCRFQPQVGEITHSGWPPVDKTLVNGARAHADDASRGTVSPDHDLAEAAVQSARIEEAGFALERDLNGAGDDDSAQQSADLFVIRGSCKFNIEPRVNRCLNFCYHSKTFLFLINTLELLFCSDDFFALSSCPPAFPRGWCTPPLL